MAAPKPSKPLGDGNAILPILNRIAIFGGLSDKQLETLFKLLETVRYAKGEFIFERGDAPSHIYVIRSGRVELLLDVNGSYLALDTFGVGECFGETAVIGMQRHTASVVTTEDTELIVLPRRALFRLWDEDKALFAVMALNIAREACRRLNETDEVLLQYFGRQK